MPSPFYISGDYVKERKENFKPVEYVLFGAVTIAVMGISRKQKLTVKAAPRILALYPGK